MCLGFRQYMLQSRGFDFLTFLELVWPVERGGMTMHEGRYNYKRDTYHRHWDKDRAQKASEKLVISPTSLVATLLFTLSARLVSRTGSIGTACTPRLSTAETEKNS